MMNATLLISGRTDTIRGLAEPILKMPLDNTSGIQNVDLLIPDALGNDPLVAHSFNVVKNAMKASHGYAWAWHCNVTMSMVDEGVSHEIANRGASRFMKLAFDVDTSKFEEFKYFETQWKKEPDMTTEQTMPAPTPKVKCALCCEMSKLPITFQNAPNLTVLPISTPFWNTPTKLVDRAFCETDETLRQIIPYIVLHNPIDSTFFTYSRGDASGELRLRSNLSLGLGGHMDELVPEGHTLLTWCLAEAHRELEEEVGITTPLPLVFEGLLCDPTNPVGRVHIGLLSIVSVDPNTLKSLEAGVIENGAWLQLSELTSLVDSMENWSKAVVEYLVKREQNPLPLSYC